MSSSSSANKNVNIRRLLGVTMVAAIVGVSVLQFSTIGQIQFTRPEDDNLATGPYMGKPLLNPNVTKNNIDSSRLLDTTETIKIKKATTTTMPDQPLPPPIPDDKKTKPLNILILYPDDWRHDSIGGVGPVVQTPFLSNKLARNGIRFSHNCVTTSICWVSRATYFTGQYASRHKSLRLLDPVFYQNFSQAAWPGLLRQNGYYVGHVGKWQFHDDKDVFRKSAFDYANCYEGRHWFDIVFRGPKTHASDHAKKEAIKFLNKRPKDKPFALTVAFVPPKAMGNSNIPGAQWQPKNETMSLYENDTIPEPEMEKSWEKLPYFMRHEGPARSRWKERFEGSEKYQISMKNYYRMITEVDEACEAIFNKLSKQGILNETMVIFTTDNGFFHGEHGLAGKWYPYQESIRVPLIIWDPRMPSSVRDTVDSSYTLNIDLAPTILGAAGIPPHPRMQGRDMSRLYRGKVDDDNKTAPWREEFFYEYKIDNGKKMPMATALVRKDFKYIHWPQFDYEELFDLESDPLEQSDIAKEGEFVDLLSEMRNRHNELEISVV